VKQAQCIKTAGCRSQRHLGVGAAAGLRLLARRGLGLPCRRSHPELELPHLSARLRSRL